MLDESTDVLWTGGTDSVYAPAGDFTLAVAFSLGPGNRDHTSFVIAVPPLQVTSGFCLQKLANARMDSRLGDDLIFGLRTHRSSFAARPATFAAFSSLLHPGL